MQLNIFDTTQYSSYHIPNWNLYNNQFDIPGLRYIPNFISSQEHEKLIAAINQAPWITDLKRRVQHYGWRYNYKSRNIDYSMYLGALPSWIQVLAERLFQQHYLPEIPDQVIVNEYQPGQGIANHVDCEPCFGNAISSLSLGSSCIMELINLATHKKVEMMLEPGSLIVISGESRYNWTHGIPARKSDLLLSHKFDRRLRLSMTFRNVVLPNSNCQIP